MLETHDGVGGWASDEWILDENGDLVTFGEGWSGSTPTGRNLFECEECGHGWRIKNRSIVTPFDRTEESIARGEIAWDGQRWQRAGN